MRYNKERWFQKLGFESNEKALEHYNDIPYGYLLTNVKRLLFNKEVVDAWYYNEYLPHKKLEFIAIDISKESGRSVDLVIRQLNEGYTREEIIRSAKFKISINNIRASVYCDGEWFTLFKYCEKYNFNYDKVKERRKEINNELVFLKMIEMKDFSDCIKRLRTDGLEIDGTFYTNDELSEILSVDRKTILSKKSKNVARLKERIREKLNGKVIQEETITLPNGISIGLLVLARLYNVYPIVIRTQLEKGDVQFMLFNLEQRRFKVREIHYCYNGRDVTVNQVIKETGAVAANLYYDVRKFGFQKAFDAAYLGRTVSQLQSNYHLSDGTYMTKKEVCEKYNIYLTWLLAKEKKYGKSFIEEKISNGELLTLYASKPVVFNIDGVEVSRIELANFLNIKLFWLDKYKNNIQHVLIKFHFKERLQFKDNSPYTTWFCEDTWEYQCPVCQRKLLLSTEELKTYKHDDKLCKEYEIM